MLAILAVLGTAIATSNWYALVRHDEVGRVALFLFLLPVFGLVLAMSVLGERPGETEIAGVLLTLGGGGWAMRDTARHFLG